MYVNEINTETIKQNAMILSYSTKREIEESEKNSWNSILAAYAFILAQNIISPLFGYSAKEIIAGSLFIIISNISILILIINNIVRAKKISYVWLITSFQLTIYSTIIINGH